MARLSYQRIYLGNIDMDENPIDFKGSFEKHDSLGDYHPYSLVLSDSPAYLWAYAHEPWKMWNDGAYVRGQSNFFQDHFISETVLNIIIHAFEARVIMASVMDKWDNDNCCFENNPDRVTVKIVVYLKDEPTPAFLLWSSSYNMKEIGKQRLQRDGKAWFSSYIKEVKVYQREDRREGRLQQSQLKQEIECGQIADIPWGATSIKL